MIQINIAKKIGIFYQDRAWADEKFKEICDQFHLDPNVRYQSLREHRLAFKDGSVILFLPATDNSRGMKFDEIYYQSTIPDVVLNALIIPMLKFKLCLPYDGDPPKARLKSVTNGGDF